MPARRRRRRQRPARSAWVRLAVLVVLLMAFASWVVWGGTDLVREARLWVDSLGLWGPVVFAICYDLAVTALLTGSVLTASAGALFGLVGTVLAGATAGAALSFGLARWLGRPVVARYAGSGRLARLDAYLTRRGFAVGEGELGDGQGPREVLFLLFRGASSLRAPIGQPAS